ncbi:hypothetical protein CBL_05194 [Carabus blaptoides fortunei]
MEDLIHPILLERVISLETTKTPNRVKFNESLNVTLSEEMWSKKCQPVQVMKKFNNMKTTKATKISCLPNGKKILSLWDDESGDNLVLQNVLHQQEPVYVLQCHNPQYRLLQYKNKANDPTLSHQTALTHHAITNNHTFDFDNTKIIDTEPY